MRYILIIAAVLLIGCNERPDEQHKHGDIENIRKPKNDCEAYAIRLYWQGVDEGRKTAMLELHECPACHQQTTFKEAYYNYDKVQP